MIDPRLPSERQRPSAAASFIAAVAFAVVAVALGWLAFEWRSDGCGCGSNFYDEWAWVAAAGGCVACGAVAVVLGRRALRSR